MCRLCVGHGCLQRRLVDRRGNGRLERCSDRAEARALEAERLRVFEASMSLGPEGRNVSRVLVPFYLFSLPGVFVGSSFEAADVVVDSFETGGVDELDEVHIPAHDF